MILDLLGGRALGGSYSCLSEFGRIAVYGFSKAEKGLKQNYLKIIPEYLGMKKFSPSKMMMANKGAFGFHLGLIKDRKNLVKEYGDILFKWLDDGVIYPVVDKIFPLEKASKAQKYISETKNFGKALLTPDS